MEQPFVVLIVDREPADAWSASGERYPLLHITFMEESYDATCIAIQTIVEGLPNMFAGDPVRVRFIHARAHLSADWEGVMPSRYEVDDRAVDPEGVAWAWREFENAVHRGTRP